MTNHPSANDSGLNLDHLEALAEAVPEHLQLKGWYVAPPSFGQQHVYADNFKGQGRQHIASLPAHKTYFGGLAEFIAAFGPATVKQLIALARRAALANQPAPTVPAGDALDDRAIMEEWDRHYLPGKADGIPFLKIVVKFARAMLSAHQPAQELAFPERDPSKPAEQQGLFRKFDVRRVDGSDQPGGKHQGCRYYVLDLTHDQHAPAAMRAYAAAARSTHPQLAADIEAEFGAAQQEPVAAPQQAAAPGALAIEAAKLAPILRSMCEGGDMHGDGVDIYADDYIAGDGDTYVVRAAALLEQIAATSALGTPEAPGRDEVLEEAALACEAWGKGKVAKWADDPEMSEDAKARAWDALQCASTIRELKQRAAQLDGGQEGSGS